MTTLADRYLFARTVLLARLRVGFPLLFLFVSSAFSQIDPVAGILPFATRDHGIDLATSSITIALPVRNKNGKIPFSYSLVLNSHVFKSGSGSYTWNVSPSFVGEANFHAFFTWTIGTTGMCNGMSDPQYSGFVIYDQTGAQHPLSPLIRTDTGGCYPPPTGPQLTIDQSGYSAVFTYASAANVYDRAVVGQFEFSHTRATQKSMS